MYVKSIVDIIHIPFGKFHYKVFILIIKTFFSKFSFLYSLGNVLDK